MGVTAAGVIISEQTYGEKIDAGQVAYLKSDGRWYLARANAEATSAGDIAIALDTAAANGTGRVLQLGYVANSAWALTPGRAVYISPITPGSIMQDRPAGVGDVVRGIGYAISATAIHFDPTPGEITIATHTDAEMPHKFQDVDTGTVYRYGFKQEDGCIVFVYEEVV